MKRRLLTTSVVLFFSLASLSPQTQNLQQALDIKKSQNQELKVADQLDQSVTASAQVAMATPGYPVTAGDVYTLSYAAGGDPVIYTVMVDSSYKIKVSNLAVLDASGKTFLELKNQVESVVSKNYPLSGVQLVLLSPAVFTVTVRGEVTSTSERTAWPLTRLSEVVNPSLTKYSSIRDVTILSAGGKKMVYDLFKATRFGDLSQNPYVRPGDVVTVNRVARLVTIAGAVERPGTYQLLEGENLQELIRVYGSGYAPMADPSRIEIVRNQGSTSPSGDKLYFNDEAGQTDFSLRSYDVVNVSLKTDLRPVIFVEGAIGNEVSDAGGLTQQLKPEGSTRIALQFTQGENYANMVRTYRAWFTPESDTAAAYLIREGKRIPINLNLMLYDASYRSEFYLQDNDTLVVPFRQYFVSVAGAVALPGRYPYIPDRDWSYYIGLAGGFDTSRNSGEKVNITDMGGRQHKKDDPIFPETTITASTNAFLFYFKEYAPVVTTVLSVVTAYLTIQAVTK